MGLSLDKPFVTKQWRKERRKKDKQLHLNIQNIAQKTKDRATRIH
jgi:alkyl hydroperoxide reductase subunit AhpC